MAQRSFVEALQPEIRADLYGFYDELRENGPCFWDEVTNAWVVTDYEAVSQAAIDPRLSSLRYLDAFDVRPELRPIAELFGNWMLYVDPPDHTRLRALVSRTFTPKAVQGLKPKIQCLVENLLDAVAEDGQMDFIAQFASKLPLLLMCDMFELPTRDAEQLHGWCAQINLAVGNEHLSDDDAAVAVDGQSKFDSYLQDFLGQHTPESSSGLFANFLNASADEDRLSQRELIANMILFLIAGHATTTNLLGNGLLALLENRLQRATLQTRPNVINTAIEEMLRFDSPVQVILRRPLESVILGDEKVEAGDRVLLLNGAANRDPNVFDQPNEFRIERAEARHISFGKGPHFCIGAALARLEAEVAFPAILDRLSRLELASDHVEWRRSLAFRELTKLDVTWS